MPIYEYRCEACGHNDEHLQKVSEKPLTVCPACGKPKYRKQLSAAGFQLKGTGWYATDYAKSGSTPESKGGGKDGKKTEGGTGGSESGSSSGSEKSAASTESTPAASTSPAAKPETKT